MEHYISPIDQDSGDLTAKPGSQIHLVASASPGYNSILMHVYDVTVKSGDTVRARQLLAYHAVQADNAGHCPYEIVTNRVDSIAMRANAVRLVSMLTLLAPSVSSAYSKVGVTTANSIWSQDFRATNPCFMRSRGLFIGPINLADTVVLKN
jgi:hypothetical protein